MKIKLSKHGVLTFLLTLLVFLDLEPYFVWGQVSPVGYRIYTVVIFLTTLYMAWGFIHKRMRLSGIVPLQNVTSISRELFIASTGIVFLLLYQFFLSGHATQTAQPFNLSMLCIYIGLMLFSLQDHLTLKTVFSRCKTIFAITLIPSILFLLLSSFGIELPSFMLTAEEGRALTGQYYEAILGLSVHVRGQYSNLDRICGIYREPGFVGTVGALFLAGDNFNLKKRENQIIAIACVCTFSLAFYVLVAIGLILKGIGQINNRKRATRAMVAVLGFVLFYIIFMSVPFPIDSPFATLQERLIITESGLSGDNRFGDSIAAMLAYDQFIRGDFVTILLGYGVDNRVVQGTQINIWQKVCSYKEYIFQFGLIGFGMLISWLVTVVRKKYKMVSKTEKWEIVVLLLVFLISIYQRPNVARFHYFCLLFGGASNLALSETSWKDKK